MSLQTPAQITFHQTAHSDAVEADIRDKIASLEALSPTLVSCRVVVEREHFDRADEGPIAVRFELGLPGGKTIVGGAGDQHESFLDAHAAARAAFEVTRRQLQHHVDRHR